MRGYIDRDGVLVIDTKYERTTEFSEGLAAVCVQVGKDSYKWGYIDREGQYTIRPTLDFASPFENGLARIDVDNVFTSSRRRYYIDKNGATVQILHR